MNAIEDVVGYLVAQKSRIECIERQLGGTLLRLGTLADRLSDLEERLTEHVLDGLTRTS